MRIALLVVMGLALGHVHAEDRIAYSHIASLRSSGTPNALPVVQDLEAAKAN